MRKKCSSWLLTLAALAPVVLSGPFAAAQTAPAADWQSANNPLQKKLDAMQQQMDALKQQMQDIHQAQLQALDNAVLMDIKSKGEFPDGDVKVGYDDGFYIQQGTDFKLKVNGLLDYRYTYARDDNRSGVSTTALGGNHGGDFDGFSLTNAQLAVSGYAFHNIIYKLMGNFGGVTTFNSTLPTAPPVAPAQGTFQVNELWGGYSFSPQFNIRGGSLVVPMVPERTLANYGGSEFPDFEDTTLPFSPGYAMAADVYGALAEQTLSYDVMFGDGSSSQDGVDSATPYAGRDNRFSAYTREQFAGSGKLSDFLDEPDVQNHSTFVWILGAGGGFESQDSTSKYNSQSYTKIPGISEPGGTPGFAAPYTLDGNLYRAALDFRTKYQGWSTFSQVLYQNVNDQADTSIVGPKSNLSQYGYFVQSGYFLMPRKLELAARIGQLFTDGLPHHMDVYEIGLNYYLFDENMKLQATEKYIPRKAALTDSYGSLLNTQDAITELQMQVKF